MSKIKINVDRPGISSEEIGRKMNFEEILAHQKVMAKPFYKSAWFYGVTGVASVTLIASTMYSLSAEGDKLTQNHYITDNPVLLNLKIPDSKKSKKEEINNENKINKKETLIEEKITLKIVENKELTQVEEISISEGNCITEKDITVETETKEVFSFIDLYPRIAGRLNGVISKNELLNDEGLVTNANVKIVSFQLHLVDASGGKVFESKGNTLNEEMKTAINTIGVGEEVYFEKIDGQASTGEIVRLSPLRYVLLN